MRCPRCQAEYSPDAASCTACGWQPVGDAESSTPPPAPPVSRLGTFDPVVVPLLLALLDDRGVGHETRTTDRGVEVLVPLPWRDDLRAELTLRWGELVAQVDPDAVPGLSAAGGSAPGWLDAPRGGHVDRAGRLVVAVDTDEVDDDAARVLGPALLTIGAILIVVAWQVIASTPLVAAGVALVLAGLLSPR
jgi:hypothetical protein